MKFFLFNSNQPERITPTKMKVFLAVVAAMIICAGILALVNRHG